MRRPSAPLVISIIALVGAWGGPAVARSLIGSQDIKDRSIQGRDVATSTITSRNITSIKGSDVLPDALDGTDIKEDTLRIPKVPLAENADQVNGVKIERFAYDDPEGKSAIFYDTGGLRVSGFCNSGAFEAVVTATADDGIVRSQISSDGGAPVTTSDDDFDTGKTFLLFPSNAIDVEGSLTYYEPGGAAVIIQFLGASNLPASTGHQCLIGGVAIRTAAD